MRRSSSSRVRYPSSSILRDQRHVVDHPDAGLDVEHRVDVVPAPTRGPTTGRRGVREMTIDGRVAPKSCDEVERRRHRSTDRGAARTDHGCAAPAPGHVARREGRDTSERSRCAREDPAKIIIPLGTVSAVIISRTVPWPEQERPGSRCAASTSAYRLSAQKSCARCGRAALRLAGDARSRTGRCRCPRRWGPNTSRRLPSRRPPEE